MSFAYIGLMTGVIIVSVYNKHLKKQCKNKEIININTEPIDKINKKIKR